MKLFDILRGIDLPDAVFDGSIEIKDLVYDSRKACPDTIFVCICGFQVDGHGFAKDAYNKGVRVFAVEKQLSLPEDATVIHVEDTRKFLALASANLFGNPNASLNVIGITGTKGKTSTSFMIKGIYEAAGHKVGVIGSTGIYIGDTKYDSDNSTPESYLIHKYFREMLDCGCDTVVIEATSQGFKLSRTHGIRFNTSIFTNLSPDHIGVAEHSDFDEYLNCKKMIFDQSDKVIINRDTDYYDRIVSGITCPLIEFSKGGKSEYGFDFPEFSVGSSGLSTTFECKDGDDAYRVSLNTPGYFSLYNAVAAVAVARTDGISKEHIKAGLSTAFVKGRMEIVPTGTNFTVIIDFAHNEYSVKNLFDTIKRYNPKRIISVFGCGGNRSKLRRYAMGEVIGRNSDLSVITADNSRYERVLDIIDDILVGMTKTDGRYFIIPDRRRAIKEALLAAKEGDVVLLIGKGHEMYEEIEGVKYPFDERQVVYDALKEI